MTTNGNELNEMLNVLEEIRSARYPHIPADLIKDIVNVEFEQQDERDEGHIKTKKLVDNYLKTITE